MHSFERKFFGCGFGGQGVMVLGQLLAYGGIHENRHATWLPSYGPEMRGGTANCSVVVSDDEVSSPFVNQADVVAALNQPSIEKFECNVKKDGFLVYNTDIIVYRPTRDDIKVVPLHANELAREAGSEKVMNVVVLGAVVAVCDLISHETALSVIREKLGKKKPEFLEMNLKAYELGRKAGLAMLG